MGSALPNRRQVVLVVEDEPLLRMAAVDMVENAGFEAVEAADSTEAVEILQARPDIRIVFTDIDMPRGMDGMRLAAAIRDRWPPIEIIITSGYHDAGKVRLPPRAVFFPKPPTARSRSWTRCGAWRRDTTLEGNLMPSANACRDRPSSVAQRH